MFKSHLAILSLLNSTTTLHLCSQVSSQSIQEIKFTLGYAMMIDELAIESHLCYDPISNTILGTCHEHSGDISLKFNSMNEAELVLQGLKDKSVHFASEVSNL